MFYGPVHGAEEGAAVFYQAVKVNLLQKVALSLAEIIRVKPSQTEKSVLLDQKLTVTVRTPITLQGGVSTFQVRSKTGDRVLTTTDSDQTVNHTCGGTSARSLWVSPPSASSGPG